MLKLSRCRKQVSRHFPRSVKVVNCVHAATRNSSSIPEHAASPSERNNDTQARVNQRKSSSRLRWNLTSTLETNGNPPVGRDEQIVTSSLEETLQHHRDYNAESVVIKKINSQHKGDSYLLQAAEDFHGARHVALEREAPANDTRWADYAGEVRTLTPDWAIVDDLPTSVRQPWMIWMNRQGPVETVGIRRLSNEIEAANQYLSPSSQEAKAASAAFADIQKIVLDLMPSISKVDLIGSRQSQLSHPLSDLDINLVLREESGTASASVLRQLYRLLRFVPARSNHKRVLSPRNHAIRARVPLIMLCHLPTGLECQIQCANSGYGSLEVARGLRAEFPSIEPLFRVIRQMLRMRGLSDGQRGGLTSYPVLNMIAISLKMHASRTASDHVGQQLLDFLRFYSEADFYSHGITYLASQALRRADKGSTREMLEKDGVSELVAQDPVGSVPVLFDVRRNLRDVHKARNSYQMVLHDPANLYNDLGCSAYLIKHVQETFRVVREDLLKNMLTYERALRTATGADNKLSLLAPIIGGDYSLFQLDRSRLSTAA